MAGWPPGFCAANYTRNKDYLHCKIAAICSHIPQPMTPAYDAALATPANGWGP